MRTIRDLRLVTVGDATWLYSASDDGMIKQWDMSAGREGTHVRTVNKLTESNAHTAPVTCLTQYNDVASGGVFLVSSGDDQKLCVWNAADLTFVAGCNVFNAVTCSALVRSTAGDQHIILGCQNGALVVKKFGSAGIEDIGCVYAGGKGHNAGGPIVAVLSGGDANFVSVSETGQILFWCF